MRLSEFLEPDLVVLDLRSRGIEDTLATLVDHVRSVRDVEDPGAMVQALIERETAHSTSLGNGVALPHATVPGIEHPLVLIAVAPEGADFGEGPEPVRLFFLLLSPLAEAGTHIKLLARIVRLVRKPEVVAALVEAETAEALLEEVERLDALHV